MGQPNKRRSPFSAALIVVVVLLASLFLLTQFLRYRCSNASQSTPPLVVSIEIDGMPVEGVVSRITTHVAPNECLPGAADVTNYTTYLSLGIGGFKVVAADSADNPWGHPTVWNLTGRDISDGVSFSVDARPTYIHYGKLWATAWWPQNWSSLDINQDGSLVNYSSVYILGRDLVDYTVVTAAQRDAQRAADRTTTLLAVVLSMTLAAAVVFALLWWRERRLRGGPPTAPKSGDVADEAGQRILPP